MQADADQLPVLDSPRRRGRYLRCPARTASLASQPDDGHGPFETLRSPTVVCLWLTGTISRVIPADCEAWVGRLRNPTRRRALYWPRRCGNHPVVYLVTPWARSLDREIAPFQHRRRRRPATMSFVEKTTRGSRNSWGGIPPDGRFFALTSPALIVRLTARGGLPAAPGKRGCRLGSTSGSS